MKNSKTLKPLFILALLAVLCISISSCSKKDDYPKSLSGTSWKGTNPDLQADYEIKLTSDTQGAMNIKVDGTTFEDGTLTYSYNNDKGTLTAVVDLSKDGKKNVSGSVKDKTMTVNFDGTTMTLTKE